MGVAQPVSDPEQAVASMRGADACSWQAGGPDGISIALQVSANSGEPFPPILRRNLLSKDDCRPADGDERVKSGPEVSFVESSFALSRDRKRLTWKGGGPDFAAARPAREVEGVGPAADAGEEMALSVVEVGGSNSEN